MLTKTPSWIVRIFVWIILIQPQTDDLGIYELIVNRQSIIVMKVIREPGNVMDPVVQPNLRTEYVSV